MAELIAVRHESQDEDDAPGLMSKRYFDRFGQDKGYIQVDDEAAQAAARVASGTGSDDLESLTIKELKARLPEGVTVPSGAAKPEYIAAIRGA